MAEAKRERSSIRFPYGDLDDAVQVARKLHDNYGLSCTLDQLAAAMGQTLSGAFRNKVATAATFGAIETARREVALTELGEQLADPQTEEAAKVRAFLHVPLYEQVFATFRGRRLPGDAGLEAEIVRLGVSSKQATKARQALYRSAEQAGFFSQGRDRLVEPPASIIAALEAMPTQTEAARPPESTAHVPGAVQHPLIVGLWKMLPDPETTEFTEDQQADWLAAAKVNLKLLYGGKRASAYPPPHLSDEPDN